MVLKNAIRALILMISISGTIHSQDLVNSFTLPSDAGTLIPSNIYPNSKTQTSTAGIQAAIVASCDRWRTIYLPAGTYLVDDSLGGSGVGKYFRFMTIMGAGPGKTVIKLKDNSARFQDTVHPKPVFTMFYSHNATHDVYYRNLSINTGKGNPGAIGLQYTSHNGGIIDNVLIKSEDGKGMIGLDLSFSPPGPALVTNTTVDGFHVGIWNGNSTSMYSMTMANITVKNQTVVGMKNDGCSNAVYNFTSQNKVRALYNSGGVMALIKANFTGGDNSVNSSAISTESLMYLRNITCSGYANLLIDNYDQGLRVPGPFLRERMGDTAIWTFKSPQTALNLPIKEPPIIPWNNDFSTWANIKSYPNIQAAFNSGKSTIYFPGGAHVGYSSSTPIQVPSTVRRIIGFMAGFSGQLVFSQTDTTKAVVVDELFGAHLIQNGKAPLYLIGSTGTTVTTASGAGDVFIDDYCCAMLTINKSSVWIRQLNLEPDASPFIRNTGGKLWVLGYKTEKPYTVLENLAGAQTEILGGLIYPVSGTTKGVPSYINSESALFLMTNVWGTYSPFIRETWKSVTKEISPSTVSRTALYVCNPDSINYVRPTATTNKLSSIPHSDNAIVTGSRGHYKLDITSETPYTASLYLLNGKKIFSAFKTVSSAIPLEMLNTAANGYIVKILFKNSTLNRTIFCP